MSSESLSSFVGVTGVALAPPSPVYLLLRPRADGTAHASEVIEGAAGVDQLARRLAAGSPLRDTAEVRTALHGLAAMGDSSFKGFLTLLAPAPTSSAATMDRLYLTLLEAACCDTPAIQVRVLCLSASLGVLQRQFAGVATFLHRIPLPWPHALCECLRKGFYEHANGVYSLQSLLDNQNHIGRETCLNLLCTLPLITVFPAQVNEFFQLLQEYIEAATADQRMMPTAMRIMRILPRVNSLVEVVVKLDPAGQSAFARLLTAILLSAECRPEDRFAAIQHMDTLWQRHRQAIATFFDTIDPVKLIGVFEEGQVGRQLVEWLWQVTIAKSMWGVRFTVGSLARVCFHILSRSSLVDGLVKSSILLLGGAAHHLQDMLDAQLHDFVHPCVDLLLHTLDGALAGLLKVGPADELGFQQGNLATEASVLLCVFASGRLDANQAADQAVLHLTMERLIRPPSLLVNLEAWVASDIRRETVHSQYRICHLLAKFVYGRSARMSFHELVRRQWQWRSAPFLHPNPRRGRPVLIPEPEWFDSQFESIRGVLLGSDSDYEFDSDNELRDVGERYPEEMEDEADSGDDDYSD